MGFFAGFLNHPQYHVMFHHSANHVMFQLSLLKQSENGPFFKENERSFRHHFSAARMLVFGGVCFISLKSWSMFFFWEHCCGFFLPLSLRSHAMEAFKTNSLSALIDFSKTSKRTAPGNPFKRWATTAPRTTALPFVVIFGDSPSPKKINKHFFHNPK